ncbi:class A beta-lactamase-related serine hydrolase [Micromonospora sp. DR5-3]|uniref:serine hydrolase n=1 Tax=unclassified Micromonospora TaxID=2617518 RepID=UPI0011DAFC72|nr:MULTISPECIES: serine hydrolase [unclassified Micromonospora]MCW3814053.1 class A beta-lactamase-related serine hydrolase [Micromonospora sp. DR5-3]TYC23595.1 serine hydrolase [Micromonospora sp. MP36]
MRVGAMVRRLEDGHCLSVEPDLVLPLASVGKVLLLGEVAQRLADGTLAADQPVQLRDDDRDVGGTGLLGRLSPPCWTVADLATAVAAVSDNAATNALLRLVTLDAVQQAARRAGLRDTTVHDRIRAERGPGVPETFATGTARELCAFLAQVATGTWRSPQACRLLRGWLAGNTDRAMVADSVGHDQWSSDGVRVENKTGTDTGVRADVGIVSGRHTVVYAVIAAFEPGAERAAVAELRRWGTVVDRLAGPHRPDNS